MVQVERKLSISHRSRIDIIASILRTAEKGARKTRIMYACNLSFGQLHIYLDFLIERNLLNNISMKETEKGESTIYRTTPKGHEFIQAYRSIRALLSR